MSPRQPSPLRKRPRPLSPPPPEVATELPDPQNDGDDASKLQRKRLRLTAPAGDTTRLTDLHDDALLVISNMLDVRSLSRLSCCSKRLHSLLQSHIEKALAPSFSYVYINRQSNLPYGNDYTYSAFNITSIAQLMHLTSRIQRCPRLGKYVRTIEYEDYNRSAKMSYEETPEFLKTMLNGYKICEHLECYDFLGANMQSEECLTTIEELFDLVLMVMMSLCPNLDELSLSRYSSYHGSHSYQYFSAGLPFMETMSAANKKLVYYNRTQLKTISMPTWWSKDDTAPLLGVIRISSLETISTGVLSGFPKGWSTDWSNSALRYLTFYASRVLPLDLMKLAKGMPDSCELLLEDWSDFEPEAGEESDEKSDDESDDDSDEDTNEDSDMDSEQPQAPVDRYIATCKIHIGFMTGLEDVTFKKSSFCGGPMVSVTKNKRGEE